jgi:hypothetical protein
VGRVLQLTPEYALSLRRVGLLSPVQRRAVAGELRKLAAEAVPGPADYEALVSPPAIGVAWARKVTGFTLWVLYVLDEERISLRGIETRRPIDVDE